MPSCGLGFLKTPHLTQSSLQPTQERGLRPSPGTDLCGWLLNDRTKCRAGRLGGACLAQAPPTTVCQLRAQPGFPHLLALPGGEQASGEAVPGRGAGDRGKAARGRNFFHEVRLGLSNSSSGSCPAMAEGGRGSGPEAVGLTS